MSFVQDFMKKYLRDVKELPVGDPERDRAARIAQAFTSGVDFLRSESSFPCPEINGQMALVWDLVGVKFAMTTYHPEMRVERIHFALAKKGGKIQGMIFLPVNYDEQMLRSPLLELGGQVYIGSQVIDHWNDRFSKTASKTGRLNQEEYEPIHQRALVHEAQFLITMLAKLEAKGFPNPTLTRWQKETLEKYPKGLASAPKGLLYDSKPFN